MKPSYNRVKALMDEKGIRPAELARETGMKSASTLTDWKNGKSAPKTDKLIMIAQYFKVPVESLME